MLWWRWDNIEAWSKPRWKVTTIWDKRQQSNPFGCLCCCCWSSSSFHFFTYLLLDFFWGNVLLLILKRKKRFFIVDATTWSRQVEMLIFSLENANQNAIWKMRCNIAKNYSDFQHCRKLFKFSHLKMNYFFKKKSGKEKLKSWINIIHARQKKKGFVFLSFPFPFFKDLRMRERKRNRLKIVCVYPHVVLEYGSSIF